MSNSTADTDVTFESFAFSLATTATAFVCLVLLFGVLRCFVPALYITRYLGSKIDAEPQLPLREWRDRDPTINIALLQKPERNLFKLIWQVLWYSEAEVLATVGLDGYMLLRLFHIGFLFFSLITGVYGLAVLLPINLVGQAMNGEGLSPTFNDISISSLPAGSGWLWAHAASVYLFTFGLLALIITAYQRFLPLRYGFLAVPQPSRFTCLAVDLPPSVVDDKKFHEFMEKLYPDQVHSVCLITKTQRLSKRFEKRNKVVKSLERLNIERDQHKARISRELHANENNNAAAANTDVPVVDLDALSRPRRRSPWCAFWRQPIDLIENKEIQLRILDKKIFGMRAVGNSGLLWNGDENDGRSRSVSTTKGQESDTQGKPEVRDRLALTSFKHLHQIEACLAQEMAKLLADPTDFQAFQRCRILARMTRRGVFAPTAAGFVTFKSLATAQIAPQVFNVMPSIGLRSLKILRAPEPRDIMWQNASMPHALRMARGRSALLLATALSVVYTIPVSIISSFTSMDSLSQLLPGLEDFLERSGISRAFIQGLLPAIILQIFMALAPLVFRLIAAYGGARSHSEKMNTVVQYYFWFKIWTTLLVFSVTGTVWGALLDLVNNPASVVQVLAGSLPQLSSFYCSYIMLQAWVTMPVVLLGPDRLFMYFFRRQGTKTPRDRREVRQSVVGTLGYDTTLPMILLIFVIGTIYTSINPLVSPVCLIYFMVAYCILKHQMLYVANKEYETGGEWFAIAVNRLIIGLIIYQLTMIGILSLKEALPCVWFVVPCPFLTLLAWRHIDVRYRVPSEYLPIATANDPESAFQTKDRTKHNLHTRWQRAGRSDLRVFAAMNVMRGRIATRLLEKAREAKARVAQAKLQDENRNHIQSALQTTEQDRLPTANDSSTNAAHTQADQATLATIPENTTPKASRRLLKTPRAALPSNRFLQEDDRPPMPTKRTPRHTTKSVEAVGAHKLTREGVDIDTAAHTVVHVSTYATSELALTESKQSPASPPQALHSPTTPGGAVAVTGAPRGSLRGSPVAADIDATRLPGYQVVENAFRSVYLDPALRTKFDLVYTFDDGTISPFQVF